MTTITLNDIETCEELSAERMSSVAGGNFNFGFNPGFNSGFTPGFGGISPSLQHQLNMFGAQLHMNGQYLFNPNTIMNAITTSQRAWRRDYGRQMPWDFRLSWL